MKGLQNILVFLLKCIHFALFLLMCFTGFCGRIDPSPHPWLVSATLCFGPIALAYCILTLMWLIVARRYFFTSLLGLLVCIIPLRTYFPLNFTSKEEPENSLKILSYNVKGYSVGDNEKYCAILDYIHQSDASIMCLQEAENTNSDKHLFDSIMQPWTYRDTLKMGYNALALYSKLPIIDRCFVKSSDNEHGAVIYRILHEKDTIAVINCHFISNLINEDDKSMFKNTIKKPVDDSTKSHVLHLAHKIDEAGVLRAHQAQALMKFIKKLGDMPIIVCGDFNDSPMSYVHYLMTEELNDSYTRKGFGTGISFHESGMYFRIDHIFCSDHWKCKKSLVDNNCKSSDHYPITSWLKLE